MRYLLLILMLLMGTAWGAVVPDGSRLPPADPDAPTATLPGPGGVPVRVPAVGPGATRTGGESTDPAPNMSTTSLAPSSGGTGGKSVRPGKAAPAEPVAKPSPAEVPRFSLPNGQPVPWSLIALAVLLLMFSVGGGVYFYQSRED